MKTTLALITFIATTAFSSLHAAILAGPITNPTTGHQYYLLTEDTWQSSEAQAVALGGHLATINDQAEQDWVFSTFGAYGDISRSLWIGLHQVENEGNYQWVSGEPLTYTHWCCDQPDNSGGTESFVHMINVGNIYGHAGGLWNDLNSPNTTFPTFNPLCGVVEVVGPRMTIQVACVDVCWTTRTNRQYQPQYRSELTTNTWVNLGAAVPGNGLTNCITDTVRGEPRQFYRVVETQ